MSATLPAGVRRLELTPSNSRNVSVQPGTPLPLDQLLLLGCVCATQGDCTVLDDGDVCNGMLACEI